MLSLPPSVRLFVATQPVDGRKGVDSLMVLVRDVFRHDPLSGHLFVFFSKRCDRVRVVYWDRSGFAMWTKRLERGRFYPALSPAGTLAGSSLSLSRASIWRARSVELDGSHASARQRHQIQILLPDASLHLDDRFLSPERIASE
jgi:transposase